MSGAPAATFDPLWQRVVEALDRAPGADPWARAADVSAAAAAVDGAPGMERRSVRQAIVAKLRRRLHAEINAATPADGAARARAVVALQLFSDVGYEGKVRGGDVAGFRHRVAALQQALELDAAAQRMAREHVVPLNFGELGSAQRSPLLFATFLDWVLGERPGPGERARELYAAMLRHRVLSAEHFLWYHLRRTRADAAALFARNEPAEIEGALGALLGDDEALGAMTADADPRHGGWRRLVLNRHNTLGGVHLARTLAVRPCARWVDVGNALETEDLRRLFGLEGIPTIALDRRAPELEHALPLAVQRRVLRFAEDGEVPAPAADFVAGSPYVADDLAQIAAVDEPTLYTVNGVYLASAPDEDDDVFRGVLAAGVRRNKLGKMRVLENVLALLRPGDWLACFEDLAPANGTACYLALTVRDDGRLHLRGAGFAARGQAVHWDLR